MKRELMLLMTLMLNVVDKRLTQEERDLSQRLAELVIERMEAKSARFDRIEGNLGIGGQS